MDELNDASANINITPQRLTLLPEGFCLVAIIVTFNKKIKIVYYTMTNHTCKLFCNIDIFLFLLKNHSSRMIF